MFGTRSEYERNVNSFSPEGRLFQVEYALGAIKLGSTAVGLQCKEGIVLASERRVGSCLLEFDSVEKMMEIDTHIGCAMSGLLADARTLVDHARVECANHTFNYNEGMSTASCVNSISSLALEFADTSENRRKKAMSRPFGVALLVGGVDEEGPALWCTDPSGTNTRYLAAAIGSAQEGAEGMLQEQYNQSMEFNEIEELALVVLRQVMEEKISCNNVEVAAITSKDKKYYKYTSGEIQCLIDRLPPPNIPTATDLSVLLDEVDTFFCTLGERMPNPWRKGGGLKLFLL
ncbi:putative proteasome subunit alpha type 5-2 [Cardiosporidium cionae]|uniref:Proteasome subunit alpha type n=1 Tax=Cardiosporidium cionae TaxID=476202 RepID=A0ABQ7J6K2_9APIC|nr:putative proteasome subunit alpha type 5-2 [Cardiosporidium cionae]|eukprot:KAF8819620.1 putative proteasome subunit alpha type 5-2 [Cardiosporidium cionae]